MRITETTTVTTQHFFFLNASLLFTCLSMNVWNFTILIILINFIGIISYSNGASLVAQTIKNPLAVRKPRFIPGSGIPFSPGEGKGYPLQ